MRQRPILLAVLLAAMLLLAPLASAWADNATKLTLSETATVTVVPDELSAVLRAEATAATAAEAQRAVNVAMAAALAQTKAVAGVVASTGGYDTYSDNSTSPPRWRAGQTLTLRSADGAALLTLVGALQQAGLAVGDLHWQLSDAAEHRARAEATKRAILALQARVTDAAGLLGLTFVRFEAVRVDLPTAGVRPMVRMMALASASQPPPSAVAEDVPVSVTVSADADLAPK